MQAIVAASVDAGIGAGGLGCPASEAHVVTNSLTLLYQVARGVMVEQSAVVGTSSTKETVMETVVGNEPKRQEPDIPAQRPDIQPEPRPEEIPQNTDVPHKESPLHADRASTGPASI